MGHRPGYKAAVFVAAGLTAVSAPAQEREPLETMVVSASRTPIPAAMAGGAVTVISADMLRRDQRAQIADILRSVPGLAVSRAGGAGALGQLRMRGGEANQVAVFIDGVRVNDVSQGSEFDLAHLLSGDIEAVEIVRGPQSALWGSDALSGVVNLVTRQPRGADAFEVELETGTAAWERLHARYAAGTEKGGFSVAVQHLDTDGHNVSRLGEEPDGYRHDTLNLSGYVRAADNVVVDARLRVTDSLAGFDSIDFMTGLPADRQDSSAKLQGLGLLRVRADTLDGRWSHEASLHRFSTANTTRTENPFSSAGADLAIADADVTTLVYQSSVALGATQQLTAALEARAEQFRQRGEISWGDPNRDEALNTRSLVLEYTLQPIDSVTLLLSGRRDRNDAFGDSLSARASISWQLPNARTRVRAALGEGSKNPTFTERFGFYTDFIGNPLLRPEHSRSVEFGVDHEFADGPWQLAATVFATTLHDEINGFVYDPVAAGYTSANVAGRSDRQGAEFELHFAPDARVGARFAASLLDARQGEPGGATTREVRRADQILSANVYFTALSDRLSVNLQADFNGEQDDYFFPPVPPYQEMVQLSAYTLLTLAARFSVSPAFEVFGRIENGLDTRYEEVFGFRAPGRQAFVGFRYRLNP